MVTLTDKTGLSSEELAPALISAPTSRPARLHTLRELKRGADVIVIGGDVGDMVAIGHMMRQLAAARPPA